MIYHYLVVAFILAASIFWVYMIIDCATKEPTGKSDKLIWILIIIFTHFIGALIYYAVRRPRRLAEVGS